MIFLLVAGIGFLLAGLISIGFGVPVKEFSFGNTLIMSGVVGGCTGAILLGLHVVVRELRAMGALTEDVVDRVPVERAPPKPRPVFPPPPAAPDTQDGPLFPGDRPEPAPSAGPPDAGPAPGSMPWQDEAATRDRLRSRLREPTAPPPAPAAPEDEPAPKKRNLLFSSSRKERERDAAKSTAKSAAESAAAEEGDGAARAPAADPAFPPRTFEEAWPESERPRGDVGPRRNRPAPGGEDGREPSAAAPERPALLERSPPPRSEEMTEVTVLKSGVVDGMAYSLYSDGSIEAQMPEGMMRFASIDELREHLDQRA
ncbi:conserved hypothetical protein [Rhodopseudomonas palustris HaA2]|uniref:DUF308 domain-containing protein n=1 Tax=Rhodopseudomonas palustris (strain HaA2) TaxID=316058 RepID=Q2IU95_RHOP2|nr:hypothetical protein [Rhodopseudomonas palustris]ABD08215.1 conserved hypothetical protein [Rhodopseudomonas palustris HaA2]